MGALIRIMFPLIGYFCVATVITLAAGYGYLRQNGTLNNENMFEIVSLLHGVDLDEIAAANETDTQDVPPEEVSFDDRQQYMRIAMLNLQAKKDDIEKNIAEFKNLHSTLDNRFEYFEKIRVEVEQYLKEQKAVSSASGLVSVREQWKNLNPKKQTKEILVKMIKDDQIGTVIEILNGLPQRDRKNILKTMDTPEDIEMLHRIEQQMLNGGPGASFIDQKLQELDQQKK